MGLVGLYVIGMMALVALLAPVISPYDPYKVDMQVADSPPSLSHLLGTDATGRDLLSLLIYGSRISMSVGLVATSVSIGIATLLGSAAGYWQGWLDVTLSRRRLAASPPFCSSSPSLP